MNSLLSWFGKYWNALALLLLLAGAIAIILLWPSKAMELPSVVEPHMNPSLSSGSGSSDVIVFGFFAFLFLVILCFLGYIVTLLRKKESAKVPEPMEKETERKDEEW